MAGLRDRPLLERDREFAVIDEAVAQAREGRHRLLVIEGAAGVGKTRLIVVARERARGHGFQDLSVRAGERERAFAFGIARGLFVGSLTSLDEEASRRVWSGQARRAAPALGLDKGVRWRGGESLQAAYNALFWLCVGLANEGPLMLAVDDAHWSDEASLGWLAYVAPRLEGLPVCIVLSSRPSEPGSEAMGTIGELARLECSDVLRPRALSRSSVAELVELVVGAQPSGAFVDRGYQATKGNPFLLHELLGEVEAAAIDVTSAASAERIAGLGSRRVSESVLARVARIGEDAVRLTRALAVLGDRVEVRDAAALAELDEDRTMLAAAELVDTEVLAEGFPLEWVHPLVRSAVYEHLSYAERLGAHERAARMLAQNARRAEAAASHLLLMPARGDGQAVELLRRAAHEASERGSPGEAIKFLQRALAEPQPETERAKTLAELGVSEHNAEEGPAIEHLTQALALTREPAERARLGLILARAIWHRGRISDAVVLLESLVGELDEHLAEPLEAELIAIARLDPRTRQVGLRVLRDRERKGSRSATAERLLLANLCFERAVSGEASAELVAEFGASALAGDLLLVEEGSENTIHHLVAWALAQCDHFHEAEAALQAAIELARREGSAAGWARALTFRVNVCYRRGLLDDAEADAQQALEHLTRVRAPLAVAFLLDVLIERGQLDAADGLLEKFGPTGELPGSVLHMIVLERRGRLRLAQDRVGDAVADLLACQRRAVEWGAGSPGFLAWRSSLASALVQDGRTSEAMELACEEVVCARACGAPRALGIALRVQGSLAGGVDGVGLLEEAVAAMLRAGASLECAKGRVELGAALRRTGRRAEAREHLQAALGLAERLGANALAAWARGELRSAGGRPARGGRRGMAALTPAELRVAGMAASGMSNRQIAEALFVIPKTVEWHLAQSYRKLGIHSRDELGQALERVEETGRAEREQPERSFA